jgi:hypothetical protein
VKHEALQSHISFLKEQRAMLIQTAVQMDQKAGDHVSLLQGKVDRSYQATLAYMTKLVDILQKVSAAVYHSLYHSQRVETLRSFGL